MDFGFNPVAKPNHKRKKPSLKARNEFSPKVRAEIIEEQNRSCYLCGQYTTYIHHVKPRGRHGRGVKTNGMLACTNCHNPKIHDIGMVDHYINVWEEKYGPDFYKDEWDL